MQRKAFKIEPSQNMDQSTSSATNTSVCNKNFDLLHVHSERVHVCIDIACHNLRTSDTKTHNYYNRPDVTA